MEVHDECDHADGRGQPVTNDNLGSIMELLTLIAGGAGAALVGIVWTAYRLRTATMSTAAGVVVALGAGGPRPVIRGGVGPRPVIRGSDE